MTGSNLRVGVSRIGRALLVLFAVFAVAAASAPPASAQCQLVSGPNIVTCSGCSTVLRQALLGRWVGLYKSGSNNRLMVPMTWGYNVYDLGTAGTATPSQLVLDDLRFDPTGPGTVSGDGQNYVGGYGVAADGQRALLSLHLPGAGGGGGSGTVVETPNGSGFQAMGSISTPESTNGLVVQKNGSRYIAYELDGFGHLYAADVTNTPGYTVGNISHETLSYFSSSALGLSYAEYGNFQYLYAKDGQNVVVIDASTPGPAGSIGSTLDVSTVPASAFQNAGQVLIAVSGAVDQATGKLYLLGAFRSSTGNPSFALILYNPPTQTVVQTFPPYTTSDSSFSQYAGASPGWLAVNPYSGDVDVFMWFYNPTTLTLRLDATSAKVFGTAIGTHADVSTSGGNSLKSISQMASLRSSQTNLYGYFVDGVNAFAAQFHLSGGADPRDRASRRDEHLGRRGVLSSAATVFVGDTLTVLPSVTPSDAVQPVIAWNLDLDYHSSTETGVSGNLQLADPDVSGEWGTRPPPASPSSGRATREAAARRPRASDAGVRWAHLPAVMVTSPLRSRRRGRPPRSRSPSRPRTLSTRRRCHSRSSTSSGKSLQSGCKDFSRF